MVTELLDAVGEGGVGEDEGDALHRPVDASLRRGSPQRLGGGLAAGEALDGLPVIVAERGDDRVQLLVRRRPQGPIEQPERLQAGLHLVHGPRRYRRGRELDTGRWPGPSPSACTTITTSTRRMRLRR